MLAHSHSVRLDRDRCMGCTNCIKRCPTEAIRVREGKAHIIDERCIDCGECIRICPHFAKYAVTDPIESINAYRYRIALPAPTLYGQFKKIKSIDHVISALHAIGFDSVFDVARGADIVTAATREYIQNEDLPRPIISSACPAVVRLLKVRFPNLLPNLLPFNAPIELAARIAKKEFCEKRRVSAQEVGTFFLTPCPAKMTFIKNPLGIEKSEVDGCISILDVFGLIESNLDKVTTRGVTEPHASHLGIGWAAAGGEATALRSENYLAVDGIHNVAQVLEEIENGKLSDLFFFEGLACVGGCVGGPLVFENKYVAKNRIRKLTETFNSAKMLPPHVRTYVHSKDLRLTQPIEPLPVEKLDENLAVAMQKMEQLERINAQLPGLDCGSCGSPSCHAFAEDIVRGEATELDCIFLLRDKVRYLARELVELAEEKDPQRQQTEGKEQ